MGHNSRRGSFREYEYRAFALECDASGFIIEDNAAVGCQGHYHRLLYKNKPYFLYYKLSFPAIHVRGTGMPSLYYGGRTLPENCERQASHMPGEYVSEATARSMDLGHFVTRSCPPATEPAGAYKPEGTLGIIV